MELIKEHTVKEVNPEENFCNEEQKFLRWDGEIICTTPQRKDILKSTPESLTLIFWESPRLTESTWRASSCGVRCGPSQI